MSTLKELIAQKEMLEKQIADVAKTELKDAVVQIRELMKLHGLNEVKLEKTVNKVAPKWKDPASDKVWTGRGRSPLWFNEATAVAL